LKREWLLSGGISIVALSMALIVGLVRVEPDVDYVAPEAEAPAVSHTDGDIQVPDSDATAEASIELIPDEPDPAYDWLRERSLELVDEYLESADVPDMSGRWAGAAAGEAQLIFASPDRKRFITLGAARAGCAEVDAMLDEIGDPLVGEPGLCHRWLAQTRELLVERGLERQSARRFLRERGVDTSVRVVLLYAGWKRTGPGTQDFRLVASRVAPVYPQSEFSVSRRVALDGVMRRLGVGPYTDTPIQLVTALLRW